MCFGVLGPIICVIVDPTVFHPSGGEPGELGAIQAFAFGMIGYEILLMSVWLLIPIRRAFWQSFVASSFAIGAIFACGIGVRLLPLSLLGVLFGLGILGFIPFVTAFVYLRQSIRAFQNIFQKWRRPLCLGALILGIICSVGFPSGIQWYTSQLIQKVIHGTPATINSTTQQLASAFWCYDACFDAIVWAYARESDPQRQAYLATTYRNLTGKDVKHQYYDFLGH